MAATAPLVPLMPSVTGLSTDGLIKSTLYDIFSKKPQMVNTAVNANTIRANCGLLPNLTYTYTLGQVTIASSMSSVGKVYFSERQLECKGWL